MKRLTISLAVLVAMSVAAQAADKKSGGNNSSGKSGPSYSGQNSKPINSSNYQPNKNTTSQSKMQNLSPKYTGKDYHLLYGTKCSFGYCYKGFKHDHWSYCCWVDWCGCTCNYCPCTCVWFYFCVPDGCWYPISYCPYGVYVF